jgi:hypothetical protein
MMRQIELPGTKQDMHALLMRNYFALTYENATACNRLDPERMTGFYGGGVTGTIVHDKLILTGRPEDLEQFVEVFLPGNDCACGGTLAVPSINPDHESGYDPCPDCTIRFPHKLTAENACLYCGMFEADGPCPSLDHPKRKVRA